MSAPECPQTTKETLLLPTVGLRPREVSRPTSFAEVRTTTRQPTEQPTRTATSNEHAESPEARSVGPREGAHFIGQIPRNSVRPPYKATLLASAPTRPRTRPRSSAVTITNRHETPRDASRNDRPAPGQPTRNA